MSFDTRRFAGKVAESRQWALQNDEEFLNTLIGGLSQTRETYGYYLCPCREGWGDKEKDRDIICPCDYAEADIAEYGHCYCGLFQTEAYMRSGKPPRSIPERRPEELFPE